ncbi:Conidial yellow pigment biosynthesis polyketide synthase [Termitomyces sp. T112]|nr:Conidial yellow pigment biosynthesis polyketide synthase [Termitomyces sp. T112]
MIKANHSLRRGNILIGSLRKHRDGGINVRWRNTFAHLQGVKCLSLPSYPFSPSQFWVEYKEHLQTSAAPASSTSSSSTGYSMLGSWVQWPSSENENTAIFETPIEKVAKWINGHSVGGMPLCLASVYIEQALSVIHLTCAHLDQALQGSHASLRKLVFVKPLVHDSSIERILITTVQIQTGSSTFRISSRMSSAKDKDTHAYGERRLQSTNPHEIYTDFAHSVSIYSGYL